MGIVPRSLIAVPIPDPSRVRTAKNGATDSAPCGAYQNNSKTLPMIWRALGGRPGCFAIGCDGIRSFYLQGGVGYPAHLFRRPAAEFHELCISSW